MPAITLKNIPDELYMKIKESAKSNFRSINSEILFRLKSSVSKNYPEGDEWLEQIRLLRNDKIGLALNDKILTDAKSKGRM